MASPESAEGPEAGPPAAFTPYRWFPARCLEVVDADTLRVDLDLGLRIYRTETIRLAGLNAPERATPDGRRATEYVVAWLRERDALPGQDGVRADAWPLVVGTLRPDKYGRVSGAVWAAKDRACLNQDLVRVGLAAVWEGRGPKPGPKLELSGGSE